MAEEKAQEGKRRRVYRRRIRQKIGELGTEEKKRYKIKKRRTKTKRSNCRIRQKRRRTEEEEYT